MFETADDVSLLFAVIQWGSAPRGVKWPAIGRIFGATCAKTVVSTSGADYLT